MCPEVERVAKTMDGNTSNGIAPRCVAGKHTQLSAGAGWPPNRMDDAHSSGSARCNHLWCVPELPLLTLSTSGISVPYVTYNISSTCQAQGPTPTSSLICSFRPRVSPLTTASPHAHPRSVQKMPRKKALIIGINYAGTKHELSGCVNDAMNVRDFLVSERGFPPPGDDMVTLTDEPENEGTPFYPTHENILSAFKWLTSGNEAGDVLWLSYSGHGGE